MATCVVDAEFFAYKRTGVRMVSIEMRVWRDDELIVVYDLVLEARPFCRPRMHA
jgi:hypothetical protein